MRILLALLLLVSTASAADYNRTLTVNGKQRSYRLHVPEFNHEWGSPLILAFHGKGMNGRTMEWYSGLSEMSEKVGFIVAYPDGINREVNDATDVAFAKAIPADIGNVAPVDKGAIFATGMSNGAIFCYKLAAESDFIAAIAPVAGTMTVRNAAKVPVIAFHGTADRYVPYTSAVATMRAYALSNGCQTTPAVSNIGSVTKFVYCDRVEMYAANGGGHTWPGQRTSPRYLGATTFEINANDLMWEFFKRHSK